MDVFADAECLPDALIYAADAATSTEEKHFARVLNFHGNVLNGGLNQAIFNTRKMLKQVPNSFRCVGIAPLATLIELAISKTRVGTHWTWAFSADRNQFDPVYIAMCYDLPYACLEHRDDPMFQLHDSDVDWVERILLKYARDHRSAFQSIVNAIE
ncbi:MAG: hypothetical protein AAGH41_09555 [Pseudomonadota bacterium]